MKKDNLQPLQRQAIGIIRKHPEITIHDFAERIGKNYQHAASLMSFARKNLGQPARSSPTKVDKTIAMLTLGLKVKGRTFRDILRVKAARASELRHVARKRIAGGVKPTQEAIAWANSLTTPDPQLPGPRNASPASSHPEKIQKPGAPSITTQRDTSQAMSVQSVERRARDPEDLIKGAGLDPRDWIIANQIINTWEIGAKHPQTGEILVEPLFQTKVRLEPVGAIDGAAQALRQLIDELREAAPVLPQHHYNQAADPHMLEVAIPDLHLGKFASTNETGEAYDLDIAQNLFRAALSDLTAQAQKAYVIDRVVFPIGNDFLTADTLSNTTTRGTAQDVSGTFERHFQVGVHLLREAIETLRMIAPVDVVVVPGNHDSVAVFALGELLGALYAKSSDVNVMNDFAQPRKYIAYGNVLLGFAHGHLEKSQSLPMLMAVEAAQAWGKAQHREIHVGHLHHTRDTHFLGTNEVDGVLLRVIPSLSAADRWHASKGYRSQRAALAFVYHPADGQRAIFRHSVLDTLKVAVPRIA